MKLAATFLTVVLFAANLALGATMDTSANAVANEALQARCGNFRLLVPFMRLWNPTINNHFYTHNDTQKDEYLKIHGYFNQGVAGHLWPNPGQPQTVPLYQLWNQALLNSFYTADPNERDRYLNPQHGYSYVGISGYVYTNDRCGGEPFWRMWNQNAKDSFYTMSDSERLQWAGRGYVTIDVAAYLIR